MRALRTGLLNNYKKRKKINWVSIPEATSNEVCTIHKSAEFEGSDFRLFRSKGYDDRGKW